MDQLLGLLISIIQEDASNTTRAISSNTNSAVEIMLAIDPIITYGKGSAICRMLTYVMGEETFDRGITVNYLLLHYKNLILK
jgi:aminopeptidase N